MNRHLDKIVLSNVKSHLSTTVELSNGFNVIGGETDEGKSIIMSAVLWVLENTSGWNPQPWPELGVKKNAESRVELHFHDGLVVTRARSTKDNYYQVNNGEKLKSLRSGVPDEVLEALDMGEANIQLQKDMYFLFNDSAGKVAKKINEVIDLGPMDNAIQKATSRVKETKQDQKINTKQKTALADKIKANEWVTEADEKLSQLERFEEAIKLNATVLTDIEGAVSGVQSVQAELAKLIGVDAMVVDGAQLSDKYNTLEGRRQEWSDIVGVVGTADRVSESLVGLQGVAMAGALAKEFAKVDAELSSKVKGLQELASVVESIEAIESDSAKYSDADKAEASIGGLADKGVELSDMQGSLQDVAGVVAEVVTLERKQAEAVTDDCVLDTQGLGQALTTVQSERKQLDKANKLVSRLAKDLSDIQTYQVTNENALVEATAVLAEARANIKECPTCGRT